MKAPASIKGLLFDKDGTLLDYWKTWIPINHEITHYAARGDKALKERMLRAGGQDPVTDKVAAGSIFAGGPMQAIVDMLAHEAGGKAPADLYDSVAAMFRDGGARNSALIDGTHETIRTLRQRGYVLGIATNDTAAGLAASLARFDILPLFDFTCGCDSGHGVKPGPGMVHGFCKATGLAAAEVAVIGDSSHDLEMAAAANAGWKVAVLSGTAGREHLGPHADIVLDDVNGLVSLLHKRP